MLHHLNFCDTTVRFDVAEDAEEAFRPVYRFFRHTMSARAERPPAFSVTVEAYSADTDVAPEVWEAPRSVVRRSSAPEFNFDAHVVDHGERRLYANRTMLLDSPLDARADPRFLVRITASATVQLLDFVRDLVIRNQEDLGTVVLHASGIRKDGDAVAIAGPKGAGKTTTLLSSLRRPGWRYFTGDKMFCVLEGDSVLVHPWRDYPYVGVGTIRADTDLEKMIRARAAPDLDRYDDSHKILVDPDVFEQWMGSEFSPEPARLRALLLPEVRPGEPLAVRRIDHGNERWARLNTIVDRQVDTTFFTWQSYLVPDYSAFYRNLSALRAPLGGTDMIRLTGTLNVDPDAVLERGAAPVPASGQVR